MVNFLASLENFHLINNRNSDKVLIKLFQKFADSQGRALSRPPQTYLPTAKVDSVLSAPASIFLAENRQSRAKFPPALQAGAALGARLEGVKPPFSGGFRSFTLFEEVKLCIKEFLSPSTSKA